MLYGSMEELVERVPTDSSLCRALHLLKEMDVSKFQKGRNEVCGDEIYINCMEYQTDSAEKKLWEAHRAYYDVHMVLEGEEIVQISSRCAMMGQESYHAEGDYQLFLGKAQAEYILKPGLLLVCNTEDVHKVGVAPEKPQPIRKAVMKVRKNGSVKDYLKQREIV